MKPSINLFSWQKLHILKISQKSRIFRRRISQKNILTKTKLFSTEIVMIQLKTIIFSHLTYFPLENPMFLSIYVLFLHFPGIPGNFFGISRISRFPGILIGPRYNSMWASN